MAFPFNLHRRNGKTDVAVSFLNIDDSVFSPVVQHFHWRPWRKGLNPKKGTVSGKLTNVL